MMSSNVKDASSSIFEFTKRKRWADLLITELADTIILVLSTECKILYCGTSVTEILGWREADLINHDFGDLLAPEDVDTFRETFANGAEFMTYSRLKTREPMSPPSVLFEIKARPTMSCILAMARPYPGRNTATLNTFLDLKIENERLQRRLRELTGSDPGANLDASPVVSNRYPPSNPGPLPLYTSTSLNVGGSYDETLRSPIRSTFEGSGSSTGPQGSLYATSTLSEHQDADDDGAKKKKAKKTHASDQYVCVTCGRTDSPEWRKGPLGPKTLCNACGLRWAKSVRKPGDAVPHAPTPIDGADVHIP